MDEYDEDHTSDIESRLYAEIYHSNSIIGDETSSTLFTTTMPSNKNHSTERTNNAILIPEKSYQSAQAQNSNTNLLSDTLSSSRVVASISTSNLQTNDNSGNPTSKVVNNAEKFNKHSKGKRRSALDNNTPNESCKKSRRKEKDISGTNECQSALNVLPNTEGTAVANDITNHNTDLRNNKNQILNPYNKQVANNQKVYKLLSPEFIHLLFGKPKNKKAISDNALLNKLATKNNTNQLSNKNKAKLNNVHKNLTKAQKKIAKKSNNIEDKNFRNVQKNRSETECNSAIQQSDGSRVNEKSTHEQLNEKSAHEEPNENIVIQHNSPEETVINLHSESSKDSVDDNSKYNTVATDKKLAEKQSSFNNTELEDSESDPESIFEVPVPPKPAPPLIELKDSEESDDKSGSDSDSSTTSSSSSSSVPQDKGTTPSRNTINSIDILEISSDSDESVDLTLNCTGVQKSISSLNEIKKMSHEINKAEKTKNDSSTIPQNSISEKENSLSDPNTSKPKTKSKNVAIDKQSKPCSSRPKVSEQEYFFQPMSEKMKSFYNESWGGENFELDELKSKMSSKDLFKY